MTDLTKIGVSDISPKISVVVPVFNADEFLGDCLKSLGEQTLVDIEFIIVDDASTDKSIAIAQKYASADPRFNLIRLKKNVGAFEARSIGLGVASGDYIGFVDADDVIELKMYEEMLGAATKSMADIAICGAIEVGQNSSMVKAHRAKFDADRVETGEIFEAFCGGRYGTNSLWNKLYRRQLITKYAMPSLQWRQDISEDAIVNIGCFHDANRVVLLSKDLYFHTHNGKSVTRDQQRISIYVQILRAYALSLKQYSGFEEESLELITGMFSRRLESVRRSFGGAGLSVQQIDQVAEAIVTSAEVYPQGILWLFHSELSPSSDRISIAVAMRNLRSAIKLLLKAISAHLA